VPRRRHVGAPPKVIKDFPYGTPATVVEAGWLLSARFGDSLPVPAAPAHELLTTLLKEVSRSFYLTMWVLPGAVRWQISLAYLLARATDTIADTPLVPVTERLEALAQLRRRILGETTAPLDFARFNPGQPDPTSAAARAERTLLERAGEAVALLGTFAPADQRLIREVLAVITSGQELDLRRFELGRAAASGASPSEPIALQNAGELDDYTYRVAGCVGEFWTRLCRAHLFADARVDDAWLVAQGIRFGKGLQLVNILRDLPADLRLGRCYLPADELTAAGLRPVELLTGASEARLQPLYRRYLGQAHAHLAAGWDYTNALPRRQLRLRLGCAWPLLIGVRTIAKLRQVNPLAAGQRVKVARREVRQILWRSTAACLWPRAWRGLFAHFER
jgi:farnesyl-diphosphate farnesyltransferase